jgi:putative heme-binding domain-containing protein
LTEAVHRGDPRIREQAVRILGRDCRENGKVEYEKPEARHEPPALKHLDALLAMADDPDSGVRRELILALRNLPTEKVGDALKKLAASWDGQDRWYLEALGLAIENRETGFVASLLDGNLYGDLGDLDEAGRNDHVALPPYFPADRNEAFLAIGTPDLPATPLSKNLGLAWRIHRRETLPLLAKVLHHLSGPDLQDAGDAILQQLSFPEAGPVVAAIALKVTDPLRKRRFMRTLATKLAGDWNPEHDNQTVARLIAQAFTQPQTRLEGIAMASATRNSRYLDRFKSIASSPKESEDVRIAAIDALAAVRTPTRRKFLDGLVAESRGKSGPNPVAEAAIRALAKTQISRNDLSAVMLGKDYPLGVRREALRTLVSLKDGGKALLSIVDEKRLPDELKTEATTVLHSSNDRSIREEAGRLLPLPKTASGRELPPIRELIRRDGDPARGETVFFRQGATSCARCHRVRGKGEWIGPDLSTIGVKYGREELLRSILNPSAAVGFSYRSQVVALADGRIVTGLIVEDTPEHLVIKDADGKRQTIPPSEIEDRKTSDLSLMPEGLAQTMTDTELVDLLSYLTTLREPVSIVGEYHVAGPIIEDGQSLALDPTTPVDLETLVISKDGKKHRWRRVDANAEGQVDLTPLVTASPKAVAYAYAPINSPIAQRARLILDSPARLQVWLNGKPLGSLSSEASATEPRSVDVDLPQGSSWILVRITGEGGANPAPARIVSTFVSSRPISFATGEGGTPSK